MNSEVIKYVIDIYDLCNELNSTMPNAEWNAEMKKLLKKYKFSSVPTKQQVKSIYSSLIEEGKIQRNIIFENKFITSRNSSGVMVVTIATKPDKFSCAFNCAYCPTEPGMPKSYLSNEPVLERASKLRFDTIQQFFERSRIIYDVDKKLDKLEVIVVGGTWSCYDVAYQYEFITDIYYAANIFNDMLKNVPLRPKQDLMTEQHFNETSKCRIISITLETRPDMITPDEIRRFREFGCTRVQIGVQHINDDILRHIRRGCYYADTVRAIKMLKDNGFKVDIHIMPNLPSSTPEEDMRMFDEFNNNPDLQVDQWKIYPCTVVPFTVIKEWYDAQIYVPYDEQKLLEVLEYAITHVKPYVRINRVIRDIPMQDIIAGITTQSARDIIHQRIEAKGLMSQDIRYREIRAKNFDDKNIKLVTREYNASDGTEYFISHESLDEKIIYSLLRLRINNEKNMCVYPELQNIPMIRELHVYGAMTPHNSQPSEVAPQHRGLGKQLICAAEVITREHGFGKIGVISGVGVREYYYALDFAMTVGGYLVKQI